MQVLAVIPARGRSKTVPHKNRRRLGGKPLVAYTIETALTTECIDRTVISTDDQKIADIARDYGAEVPFLRPAHLADDDVSVLPVVQHTVRELGKEDYEPDIVVILQPTNPFRKGEDIKRAVDKLIETNADCVVSLSQVEQHPFRMRKLVEDKAVPLFDAAEKALYAQRQDLPKVYMMDGTIYVYEKEALMRQNVFLGQNARAIVIEESTALDIDTPLDFLVAEAMTKGASAKAE